MRGLFRRECLDLDLGVFLFILFVVLFIYFLVRSTDQSRPSLLQQRIGLGCASV